VWETVEDKIDEARMTEVKRERTKMQRGRKRRSLKN